MSEKKKMPHILHLVLFLSVLGVICAGLLAAVNELTAKRIEENIKAELDSSFSQMGVVSPKERVLSGNQLVSGVKNVYDAKLKEDDSECYVFQISHKNAFTEITTLVVIKKDSKIVASVKPLSSTKGYTTNGKSVEIENQDYGVNGCSESDYEQNFRPISGATISSNSIKESIKIAFEQLRKMEA